MLLTLPTTPLPWPTAFPATQGWPVPDFSPEPSPPRRPRAGDPPAVGSAGGVATRTNLWAYSELGPPGTMSLIEPTAFDRSLADVAAGRAGVILTIAHDYDRPLCSTFDGSLTVALAGDALLFRVTPDTPEGRAAVAAIRARTTHRQASVTFRAEEDRRYGSGGRTLVVVERATLYEIAFVRRGACGRCGVWVL